MSWNPESNAGWFARDNEFTREINIQYSREYGKTSYSMPEQFTNEWDWVNKWPIPRNQRPNPLPHDYHDPDANTDFWDETPVDVAGLYSWKSNLYQFALTMFNVITGHHPPRTPIANRVVQYRNNRWNRSFYTYGGYLLEDDELPTVDRELRVTLARCLAERPADRPEYAELKDQIDRKLSYYQAVSDHYDNQPAQGPQQPFPGTWDDNLPNGNPPSERANPQLSYIRDWSAQRFSDAPPPRLVPSADYEAWRNRIKERKRRSVIWRLPTDDHPYPRLDMRRYDQVNDAPRPGENRPPHAPPGAVPRHIWFKGDYEYTGVDLRDLPTV
ncbi:hypothetical protein V8F20_011457 [Naviculisporaceae sp. PSN 640]